MLKFFLEGQPFLLRALGRADGDRYQVFFNELSEESIRCRFGHLLAKLSEPEAAQRTSVNSDHETALAILDGQQKQIVAIGRCYLDGHIGEAEIALVVSEAWRRLGLGRFLLAQLVQVAQDAGSQSVRAFIATRNAPVIRLLRSAGFMPEPNSHGEDLKLGLAIAP